MKCSAKEVEGYWHPNTFCNESNDGYIEEQTLNTVNSKSKYNIPSLPLALCRKQNKQEFVRPRWPYDMRPSPRAEKYIRDAGS